MIRPVIRYTGRGFGVAFMALATLVYLPSFLVTALFDVRLPTLFDGTARSLILFALSACVFAPACESLLLILPTVIAARTTRLHWLACAIGSLPVVLSHVPLWGWSKTFVVLPGFAWSAHCYLSLRAQDVAFGRRFAFVAGLHALWNAVMLSLVIVASPS